MVKSKRNKIVHLTQVKKKGKDHKGSMIDQVKQYIAQYKNLFVMDVDGLKSDVLMALRLNVKPEGRIFAGKNTLFRLALKQARKKVSLEDLTLSGHYGYIFTNQGCDELTQRIQETDRPELSNRLLGSASLETKDVKFVKL